ncbi:MarR family winged helix-turn-helix transcriptional regulator [Paracoccus xiamenensis]|uniref:MarR family winged helix-turn-helix transcriptional regulator n=1 Tax=Paracoccus xiamenensis TaxID=2714901 RepID=UPI00140B822E|nr:MarR family winged helix-turn-helix transcriptional regulator [Paracoccus xiamenensis]NHF72848.1 winged helix-turn-helix transcriptional regulator [Paracoccus xiamenensis]
MAEGDESGFLESYTLFLMAMASANVSAEFHRIAADQGLSVPEWRVLACLHDRKAASVTDLARLSLMEQSRLTHLIGRMQARGLVDRKRSSRNRRNVEVTLTPTGATLAADLVAQAKAHEKAAILDRLGAEDTRVFHDLLRKLMADPAG